MSHKPYIIKEFPDDEQLFSMAFHPSKNQFVVGLSSGKIECYKYTTPTETIKAKAKGSNERSNTDSKLTRIWSNRKSSDFVRALVYDYQGQYLYSTGDDLMVRKINTRSGKSELRLNLGDLDTKAKTATPTVLQMSDSFLFLGTDNGTVLVIDPVTLKLLHCARTANKDQVTTIIPMEAFGESKYKVLAAGSSYADRVDVRTSECLESADDQWSDIMCGCSVSNDRLVFGTTEGVVTVWSKNSLADPLTRINISKDESLDAVVAGETENTVYVASADGCIRLIDAKSSKILNKWVHTKDDEVHYLDLDFEYRLVSGNMDSLKIWYNDQDEMEKGKRKRGAEEDDDDDDDDDEESENGRERRNGPSDKKTEEETNSGADNVEEEQTITKKKKEGKKNKQKKNKKNKTQHGIAHLKGLI